MSDYYASFSDPSTDYFTLRGSLQPEIRTQSLLIRAQDDSQPTMGHTFVAHQTYSSRETHHHRRNGDISTNSAEYLKNGRPAMETFRHGDFPPLNLPIRAHPDCSPVDKQAIYQLTIAKFDSANATAIQKYDALKTRLELLVPDAELQVRTATANMDNLRRNIYAFSQVRVTDADNRVLDLGNGPNLPADVVNNSVYIRFTLTFQPQQTKLPPNLGVTAATFPPAISRQVYVEVLRDGNGLHPSITYDMLTNQARHKRLLEEYDTESFPFTLLAPYRARETPDATTYKNWFSERLAEVMYAALKQAGRSYIGRMDGLQSLANRLRLITMEEWDRDLRTPTYLSVEELYHSFSVHLQEVNMDSPPTDLPNLAQLFFNALTPELQEQLVDKIPQPPIGTDTFTNNMARLNVMKRAAEDEERNVKRFATIARSSRHLATTEASTEECQHTFLAHGNPPPPPSNIEQRSEQHTNKRKKGHYEQHGSLTNKSIPDFHIKNQDNTTEESPPKKAATFRMASYSGPSARTL